MSHKLSQSFKSGQSVSWTAPTFKTLAIGKEVEMGQIWAASQTANYSEARRTWQLLSGLSTGWVQCRRELESWSESMGIPLSGDSWWKFHGQSCSATISSWWCVVVRQTWHDNKKLRVQGFLAVHSRVQDSECQQFGIIRHWLTSEGTMCKQFQSYWASHAFLQSMWHYRDSQHCMCLAWLLRSEQHCQLVLWRTTEECGLVIPGMHSDDQCGFGAGRNAHLWHYMSVLHLSLFLDQTPLAEWIGNQLGNWALPCSRPQGGMFLQVCTLFYSRNRNCCRWGMWTFMGQVKPDHDCDSESQQLLLIVPKSLMIMLLTWITKKDSGLVTQTLDWRLITNLSSIL